MIRNMEKPDNQRGVRRKAWLLVGWMVLFILPCFINAIMPAQAEQSGPFASLMVHPELERYSPTSQVTGGFRIQGSDTMHALMRRLVTDFQARQPRVAIDLKSGGSSKAISEFLRPAQPGRIVVKEERLNQIVLVSSSRELLDSEVQEFSSSRGYAPLAIPIGIDAVAVYVHKDNPISGLTLDQVDAIFSTTHLRGYKKTIQMWGDLGLTHGWEKAQIHLYGRDRKSGTRAFFQEHVLAGGEVVPSLQEEPGAASVILALSRDQLGIGYSGIGLAASTVRIVPLAERAGTPFVTPSASSLGDQTYPLRRILYVYLDRGTDSTVPPAVQEFLTFIKSKEGQEAVVKAGFYPLPIDQVEKLSVAVGSLTTSDTSSKQ